MIPFTVESARCRAAQSVWSRQPLSDRVRVVREIRHLLVEHADTLAEAARSEVGRDPDEVVTTDILPTAAACKFLAANAVQVLRPRRVGRPPLWLLGCHDTIHRRPHGVVGVIGTWNYPTFLNAVPILHALTAGNGVLWKPSEVAPRSAEVLHDLFMRAGVASDLLVRLPATREAGPQLADADIDLIHFTGSDTVGRALAARLGERLIPSVLELSGVDAVFVTAGADVRRAARSAWYGAMLNAGQTCMASRRAFVDSEYCGAFREELRGLIADTAPVRLATPGQARWAERVLAEAEATGAHILRGPPGDGFRPAAVFYADDDAAIFRDPLFAPVLVVRGCDDIDDAVAVHNANPFGLAAAVFSGEPTWAAAFAARLRCGMVVVNDVIVPTAHPETPFGGRGASGWGVTQGTDGLLAMTVPQVVTVRRGRFRPHVDALLNRDPAAPDVTRGLLRLTHGRTLGERWRGLRQMLGGLRRMK